MRNSSLKIVSDKMLENASKTIAEIQSHINNVADKKRDVLQKEIDKQKIFFRKVVEVNDKLLSTGPYLYEKIRELDSLLDKYNL